MLRGHTYRRIRKPRSSNKRSKFFAQLHAIKPTTGQHQGGQHVMPDPEILTSCRINPLERDFLFAMPSSDTDVGFVHTDFTTSNCIVDNDKIFGIIDWEMAGFWLEHCCEDTQQDSDSPDGTLC
ncbi:hypothetical protein F4801DRAFT_549338 [Xylaria longipes]|nr:hypothetical protein F4801DRAFT_549338 [Xylaria longipes]